MMIRFSEDTWRPREHTKSRFTVNLAPEQLVIWDRKPYRVVETRERDRTDWDEKYREAWVKAGMPDPATWDYRPMVIVLQDEERPKTKPLHLIGPAYSGWSLLPEHYALCRLCHELPPCLHVHHEAIAKRATERFEKEMAILPGCCHACREPITRRQKSVRFTGPNLIRPDLGDDSATFHLRSKCFNAVYVYDERWAQATGKPRRFYCEGTMTIHQGGATECTELAACPGDVNHRAYISHHPEGARGGKYSACWCLAGVLA
jgi:hypothetical protein